MTENTSTKKDKPEPRRPDGKTKRGASKRSPAQWQGEREQISYEIAHDTKHSDREANSPCFAEGRPGGASVRRKTDSREEGEEGGEMKWQSIVTLGWWRPKRRSATQSSEEVGEVNNQDELLKRRVAETIKRVEADIPEPLRPYLTYRGPTPESLGAKWFPRELTIEAPGQKPQRVEVYQDGYGFLYARIDEAK